MFAITRSVCHPKTNAATKLVAMEPQRPNIYVVRSVWRRLKKGHIAKVCRDLEPVKDVKGSTGVTDKSKPISDKTGGTVSH